MAVATADDVEQRLRRSLTASELPYVLDLIDEAEVLALGHLGIALAPDPVPHALTVVVSRMVARVLAQAPASQTGATTVQTTTGPFTQGLTFQPGTTTGGPWLAAADRVALRALRSPVASLAVASSQTGRYRRAADYGATVESVEDY